MSSWGWSVSGLTQLCPSHESRPLKTGRAIADQWKVSTFLWQPRDSFVTNVMSSMYIAYKEEHLWSTLANQKKGRWEKYPSSGQPLRIPARSVSSSAHRSGPKLVKFRPSTQYRDKNNFDFYLYGRREGAESGPISQVQSCHKLFELFELGSNSGIRY